VDPTILSLLIFLAAFLLIGGLYSIVADVFLRDRSRVSRRVDEELLKRQRDKAEKQSKLFKDVGTADDEDEHPSLAQRLDFLLEQSGLDMTPRRLFGLMAMVAACSAVLGLLIVQINPIVGAVAGALLGAAAPFLYVVWARRKRMDKLTSQLPDAFDLMARVVRAGQTMSQALQAVADEFELPISAEFAYCYEQQNLGLSPELSLRDLARRTGVLEIKIFVLALLVQQQTGGNLAEMLDKLATTLRERAKIKGKIKALTAEGRLQAAVLLGLPFFLLVAITILNPGYASELYKHPELLIGMVVFEIIGALWIRKIINFDF
jgi:tight adherence protein B